MAMTGPAVLNCGYGLKEETKAKPVELAKAAKLFSARLVVNWLARIVGTGR